MISFKPGCNPANATPELVLGIAVVASCYAKHGHDCTITSMRDLAPNRSPNSLHSKDGICRAADFKTVHLPEYVRDLMLSELREAFGYLDTLPRAFDFVFESRVTSPDGRLVKEQHFHLEADNHFPPVAPPVSPQPV